MARRGNLLHSFNWAFDGIVHALRSERNMWIHFSIAAAVLIASLFFSLSRLEVVALLVAISFVLIAEMINTAIEHVVDMITDTHDPRAKIAKDVSAGAVLIAAVNAVGVAYLVFYDKITHVPYTVLSRLAQRADRRDGDRDVRRHPGGDRPEGDHQAGHGVPRRPAVGARGRRLRHLGGDHVRGHQHCRTPCRSRPSRCFWRCSSPRAGCRRTSTALLEVSVGAALGMVITLILFRLWYPL